MRLTRAPPRAVETEKVTPSPSKSEGRERTRLHRVQQTGHSSLAVTLPKSWTVDLNIRRGDPVVFRRREDGVLELRFAPARETEEPMVRELTIDATGARPGVIGRLLVGGYITGQDRIVITHFSAECRKEMNGIDQVVKHLVGMTLISDVDDRLEFEISVDPSRHQHFALHSRLSQMLHLEIDALRQSLLQGSLQPLELLPSMEDEIDRFYYLIARQVHLASFDYRLALASGMSSHNLQLGCQLLSKMLEVVADVLRNAGSDIEQAFASVPLPPAALREELARVLGRFEELLEATLNNLTELKAPESDRTLEGIRRATEDFSATRDRLMRGHDKESALLSHMVVLRLFLGMELLKIVNETIINRVTEPDVVARNGSQPVIAGPGAGASTGH